MVPFYALVAASFVACALYLFYLAILLPLWNPLRNLPGPPTRGILGNHMGMVLDPSRSPRVHEAFVKHYGRNVRIRGFLPWDQRLFTLDPVSLAHVLKHSTVYEKPWQSRLLISSLIGVGMLAAEGQVHKRQRRVATPAFSIQNMRALIPVAFQKGLELRNRWMDLIADSPVPPDDEKRAGWSKLDVCHWISRATFDVIGLAGFDYEFNAIHNESNELFAAYKEMFEIAVSQQGGGVWELAILYFPFLDRIVPGQRFGVVKRSQDTIQRVAGRLIQEKKRKIEEAERVGVPYIGKDLLSNLLRSNTAADLPADQRIPDEDILHTINTFMFAGSDTSSLSVTWIFYLLAIYPMVQERLRAELLSITPVAPLESLSQDEISSLYEKIAELPYLENVIRETLRLIPPVHSSIRVATRDDVIPTATPVKMLTKYGDHEEVTSFVMPKGSCVHVPIEAFNLDREVWGPDGWAFNPDRWDNLPEAVKAQPGLYNNILTFSAGPRSCIGMKFSIIEIKAFVFVLLTSFKFAEADKVGKANVVLTRPYVMGKPREGSQCPLLVTPYTREATA
ncbi:cytochrome-450 hydroxylase [Epithele typhae]|uniref:cytochrome-450 hydroxylase n=1 Tax=Epithele typhae TaxID=378194 RepID=UPI0020079529|nr:cytochrome-450 hydroxylase [Epithele typhae]KAH9932764.1 cytochrome-450 hydroxylase [Epithele typhae]